MHGSRECLAQSTTGRLLALPSCGFYCLQPSMMYFHWYAAFCKAMQCSVFFSEGEWFFAETFLRKFLRCRITPFLVQLHRCHCPSVPRKLSLSGCYTGSQHFDLSILRNNRNVWENESELVDLDLDL